MSVSPISNFVQLPKADFEFDQVFEERKDSLGQNLSSTYKRKMKRGDRSNTKRTASTERSSVFSNLSFRSSATSCDSFRYDINEIPISNKHRKYNIGVTEMTDIKHITDGSNSHIYSAIWNQNNTPVIIKSMKMIDDHITKEFNLERDLLMRLSHPNIVKMLGTGKKEGHTYLVMEILHQGSLMSILQKFHGSGKVGCPFDANRVLEIGLSLSRALRHIHYQVHPDVTIIHRDLKPDNVAFTDTGVLKLIDFGLSTCVRRRKNCDQSYLMTGKTGSARYMAPEVLQWFPYSESVDIYSFALVMWQVSTGLVPFGEDLVLADVKRRIVQNQERPSLLPMCVEGADIIVPEPLADILRRSWSARPQSRPTSSELVDAFSALLKKQPNAAQTPRCFIPLPSILRALIRPSS